MAARAGRVARRALGSLAALACLGGCAVLPGGGRDGGDARGLDEAEAGGPAVRYDVTFEGEDVDPELRSALASASASRRNAARPPADRPLLERRAEADLPNLRAALRSLGYYDGDVAFEVRERRPADGGGAGPLAGLVDRVRGAPSALAFRVTPGPRYRLERLAVELDDPAGGFPAPTPAELGLRTGGPADARAVLAARDGLLARARAARRPLAAAAEPDAVIDTDLKTMDVTLRLAAGPEAELAPPAFAGAEGVDRTFLERRSGLEDGGAALVGADKVAEARRALVGTGLFSTVVVREGPELDTGGRWPVLFELTERAPRSVGGGVGYRSDEGPNASAFWEHRNLGGAGERLRLDLYGSPVRQELSALARKPDVGRRGQNLLADGALRLEDTEAYEASSVGAGVGIERAFTRRLTGSAGTAYRFTRTREEGEAEEVFGLASIPLRLAYDGSDDLLDPRSGGRLTLQTAPTADTLGLEARYLRTLATATAYLPIPPAGPRRVVLAARLGLGSLAGASREGVPADERFYAGGGGSVRGFGYQLAGPVDGDDDPEGGLSLLEGGVEVRWRVTESVGVVPFVDAGTVYDAALPDLSEELRVGAGLGLRYITPIGPLRLDVGVPLNPRDGVDDPYQVYVSLGQAF